MSNGIHLLFLFVFSVANASISLAEDQNKAVGYFKSGVAWFQKGEFDKAIDDLSTVVELRPKFIDAYGLRGAAWLQKGELDKAIDDLSTVVELDPKYKDAHGSRGAIWCRKGEFDKAIEDLTTAIEHNPMSTKAYYWRGMASFRKGDYAKAIADNTVAIEFNPKFAEAYNNLGWITATCPKDNFRDGKFAVKQGRKACELNGWKEARFVATLAAAYAEARDFENAVKYQQQVLDMLSSKAAKTKYEATLALYKNGKPYRVVLPK